ncbi:MAG: membrane protein insertase YidC [bacterium]|nr:membrane protein insertase YidC [bacterium]
MDDQGKRLLIALAISFAFLFFYQNYIVPPAPVDTIREEKGATETVGGGDIPGSAAAMETVIATVAVAPAGTLEPIAAQGEETITVDTPLFRVTLSNRGAVIRSLTLDRYREELKELESHVEMVHAQPGETAFPLSAEFVAAGGPLGFSQALFLTEGKDMVLEPGQSQDVIYRYRTPEGLEMIKTLGFTADTYEVMVSVQLINRSRESLGGRAELMWAPGLEPAAGAKEGSKLSANRYGYKGAVYLDGGKAEKIKGGKLEGTTSFEGPMQWIASEDMYFVAAFMPTEGVTGALARKGTGDRVDVGVYSQLRIPPGGGAAMAATAYIGPKEMASLKAVSPALIKVIDLGFFSIIAKPLLDMLNFFHRYLGNYGLAIIILSALIKIVFIPFSSISHRSMKKMQTLQPQINALRDKYKKDRDQLNQEIMKLYQINKVNPAGGCLPILVQIPVFFALYRALLGAIELRHAPFALWIVDLSAKDPLYITPIFMGATMFLQQKMTPTTGDPRQAQIMMFMPIVFTALFLSFPAGLVIYWTVNNVLTIGHQWWMNRGLNVPVAVEEEKKDKKGKGKSKSPRT